MPGGRRTLLGIASLALHVGVIATLAALPTPVEVRTSALGDPIVIVEWNGELERAEPIARSTPTIVEPAIVEPAIVEPSPTTTPAAKRTRARTQPAASTPPAATAPPASAPDIQKDPGTMAGERPSPHALALQGLREHSTARASVPSPRVTPGSLLPRAGEHTVPLPDGSPDGPPGTDDALPRSLADAGFRRNKKGEWVHKVPGGQFTAKVEPDGRIGFKDHLVTANKQDGFAPRMAGLTEIIRKAQKRELWAHEKAKLARRTFDLRLGIAVAFAEKNIDLRIRTLYVDLLELWSASETPAIERRAKIFERWDECDETMRVKLPGFEDAVDTRIDALRKSAGQRAREKIDAFVRRQLPKGSADAYPDAELERLNRHRHSKARFAPYDTPPQ